MSMRAVVLALLAFGALVLLVRTAPPSNRLPDPEPSSVRPNFGGWVYPGKDRISKRELYVLLVKVGEKYGLTTKGSGFESDHYQGWQIAVFCKQNLTAHFSILPSDHNLSFALNLYGFKRPGDFQSFKEETLSILSRYGTLNQVYENPPLSYALLKQKETDWGGEDLTSQCQESSQRSG